MSTVPERGFGVAEYEVRLRKAQTRMAAADLSGLLILSEADLRYFSGFHTLFWQSPTRPWFLFVPADGKPIAIIPEVGAALMQQTWIDDIRTWPAPAPADDGISLLHDLLSPLARNRARLGLMKGHETGLRMPLADYERLTRMLQGLEIVDATGIVRELRMVKSDAEIEKIAHVCTIGSTTFEAVPSMVQEGQPLAEVFRAFRRECLAQGADDVPYLVGGANKGGYADVISPPSSRPLQKGDVLMLDTGATFDGFFCDFDRNWAIGGVADEARRSYDVLWRATEAAIEAALPGTTCRELSLVMRKITRELDFSGGDVGRMGHGLGMQLTEWPSLAVWDETVIKAGMVLSIEPSLSYGTGKMMVHEENILVTSGAPRLLTKRADLDLPVI